MGLEWLVLAIIMLSPWAFAAVHPISQLAISIGLSALLLLWVASIVSGRRVTGTCCPVMICLAGIVGFTTLQTISMPTAIMEALTPESVALRSNLHAIQATGLIGDEPISHPATISFEPGATRAALVKLLALLAFYVVVRYAVASPASFQRLAIASVVNGALLSVVALAQSWSSPNNVLYWNFESQGSAFGPFVCKNHFPFYVNICFGLGTGLLIRSLPSRHRSTSTLEFTLELLRRPSLLWLLAALSLMFTAILFSLSRGGVIAFAAAALFCGSLTLTSNLKRRGWIPLALVAGLVIALLGWFGAESVQKRLSTISATDPIEAGRKELWERTIPLVNRFPVTGTGVGTFELVEPQQRRPGDENSLSWEHAHNDYLETLIEGGFPQLLLVVAIIGCVLASSVRTFRYTQSASDRALVLGGLFGFTAVMIHSFGDFGMRMPAITLITAALMAHLMAAGSRRIPISERSPGSRWLDALVVLMSVLVASVLPLEGLRRAQAEELRLAALRVELRGDPASADTQIRYLAAAVARAPDDGSLRLKLANARYAVYIARRDDPAVDVSRLVRDYLHPSLRDYLLLTATSPLRALPYARLAGSRQHLSHPEKAVWYLDRACFLEPSNGEMWYLAGLAWLAEGEADRGWICWRQSLICSSARLPAIVAVASDRLAPAEMLDQLLPPDLALFVAAAQLIPDRSVFAGLAADRIPDSAVKTADQWHAHAWLLREAGRPGESIRDYHRALELASTHAEWRLELAELLFTEGEYLLAEQQLQWVIRDDPHQAGIRDLNAALVRVRSRAP